MSVNVYTIPEKLLILKIPAYDGIKAENNEYIFKFMAENGPCLPYDIFKHGKENEVYDRTQYPTVHRRIKDLVERGYIAEYGARTTFRGKQEEEKKYALTWKGFVASLKIESVRRNFLSYLKINSDLILPKQVKWLDINFKISEVYSALTEFIENTYSEEEFYSAITAIFIGYLKSDAPSIEELEKEQLVGWLKQILEIAASEFSIIYPQGIKEKIMDATILLDKPAILNLVKKILPAITDYYRPQLLIMLQLIIIPQEMGKILNDLKPTEKPSDKMKFFVENQLPTLIQDIFSKYPELTEEKNQ